LLGIEFRHVVDVDGDADAAWDGLNEEG
jgi:hypothetical protein